MIRTLSAAEKARVARSQFQWAAPAEPTRTNKQQPYNILPTTPTPPIPLRSEREFVCRFGKHAGKSLSNIPKSYVAWCRVQKKISPLMAHLIRAYDLAQRRDVIDDEVDDPASPRGDTESEPAAKRRRTALTDVRMQASKVSEGLTFNTSPQKKTKAKWRDYEARR